MVAPANTQDFFQVTVPASPVEPDQVIIDVKVFAPSHLPNFGHVNITSMQVNLCLLDRVLFSENNNHRRQSTLMWSHFERYFGLTGCRIIRHAEFRYELAGYFNLEIRHYRAMLQGNRWPPGLRTVRHQDRNGANNERNGRF